MRARPAAASSVIRYPRCSRSYPNLLAHVEQVEERTIHHALSGPDLEAGFASLCEEMAASRPTAVNLFWAIRRMRDRFATLRAQGASRESLAEGLTRERQ